MTSKLDCVREVLERYLDVVDVSASFLEGDKFIRLHNGIWLRIELRYSLTGGLAVDRISENRNVEVGSFPSWDSFKDATKLYMEHAYVKGLLQKIDEDIMRSCP